MRKFISLTMLSLIVIQASAISSLASEDVYSTVRGETLDRVQRRLGPFFKRNGKAYPLGLESKMLSLEDCIEIGLTNDKPAQVALEQARLAQLKVRQARRNLYPTLTGEWKSTEGETITDPYESLSYGLQLEQTIYDGGKLKYTLRQEDLGLEIAKKNYQKVKDELTFEIAKAYHGLIRSKMLVINQKDLLSEAEKDLDLGQRLYEAELTTEAEFLNTESLYRQIEFQLNSFENELSLVKLTLRQLLDVDNEVEIKDSFDREVGEIELTLKECVSIALDKRPEIGIANIALTSARYGERIARREGWPKFSLVTNYGRSGEAYASEELLLVDEWSMMGKWSWFFGGSSLEYANIEEKARAEAIVETTRKTEAITNSLRFSLWDKDALAALSHKKEADIVYQGSLSEITRTKHAIRLEVEKAYLDLRKALIGIDSVGRNVEFRRKELAVIKARTNLEELPLSSLLKARMGLAEEKANYIQLLANYYLARASLKQATAYAISI